MQTSYVYVLQQQPSGFHLGNNVLDFASSSSKAASKMPKPPPPTASKSQLDRLNYKVISLRDTKELDFRIRSLMSTPFS